MRMRRERHDFDLFVEYLLVYLLSFNFIDFVLIIVYFYIYVYHYSIILSRF